MLLQGPANNGGVTIGGVAYTPDTNGCVDVPPEVLCEAEWHGFLPVDDSQPVNTQVDFSKLTKKQLISFAADDLGLTLDPSLTNKDMISQIETAMQPLPDSAE